MYWQQCTCTLSNISYVFGNSNRNKCNKFPCKYGNKWSSCQRRNLSNQWEVSKVTCYKDTIFCRGKDTCSNVYTYNNQTYYFLKCKCPFSKYLYFLRGSTNSSKCSSTYCFGGDNKGCKYETKLNSFTYQKVWCYRPSYKTYTVKGSNGVKLKNNNRFKAKYYWNCTCKDGNNYKVHNSNYKCSKKYKKMCINGNSQGCSKNYNVQDFWLSVDCKEPNKKAKTMAGYCVTGDKCISPFLQIGSIYYKYCNCPNSGKKYWINSRTTS